MRDRLTREIVRQILDTQPFNLQACTYAARRENGRLEGCAITLRVIQLAGGVDEADEVIREAFSHWFGCGKTRIAKVLDDSPNYLDGLEEGYTWGDSYPLTLNHSEDFAAGLADGIMITQVQNERNRCVKNQEQVDPRSCATVDG